MDRKSMLKFCFEKKWSFYKGLLHILAEIFKFYDFEEDLEFFLQTISTQICYDLLQKICRIYFSKLVNKNLVCQGS